MGTAASGALYFCVAACSIRRFVLLRRRLLDELLDGDGGEGRALRPCARARGLGLAQDALEEAQEVRLDERDVFEDFGD